MRDLRISLIDQCNMRCRYCMPAEIFGANYPFMETKDLLTFDDIIRVIQAAEQLGVEKVRLTGGEPLLRKNIDQLIARIDSETGIRDIALTTNGLLLARKAAQLKASGLHRVNLSLDALDPEIFNRMSGGYGSPDRVIAALDACMEQGMQVKLNTVVRRGVNDDQILPLLRFGMQRGVEVRFIEYMDVGSSNGWARADVFSETEILEQVQLGLGAVQRLPVDVTAVARSFTLPEFDHYRWGIIASITRPFCGGCVRARVSANGKLYTCLFSDHGHDLSAFLGPEAEETKLLQVMKDCWLGRKDQYSELRETLPHSRERVEMSYIGG